MQEFVPEKQIIGQWLEMPRSPQHPAKVEVMFDETGAMHVRRTYPEQYIEEMKREARANAEVFRKGVLLGGTQKHWLPAARLPHTLYRDLKEKFGDDARAWDRWLNDADNRAFRLSEHRL